MLYRSLVKNGRSRPLSGPRGDARYRVPGWMAASFSLSFTLLACQDQALPDPSTLAAPVLDKVFPPVGPAGGGFTMSLQGTNFVADSEVRVAGAVIADPILRSPAELQITLPPGVGPIGPVAIEIRNPDGLSVAREDLFSYGSVLERLVGGNPWSVVSADVNGNYGSSYIDWSITTCRSWNHGSLNRSASRHGSFVPSAA